MTCGCLTLVVVGSDDLGLLRMLFVCQVSYLRKTEEPAVTTGTTVESFPGRVGSCLSARKAGCWGPGHLRPGLDTGMPACTSLQRAHTGIGSDTPERRGR